MFKINKRLISTLNQNIFNSLIINKNNFDYNYKYINQINITMNSPNNLSIYRKTLFEANIYISKDNMSIYKNFYSNNLEDLFNQIKNYINNDIKL